MCSPQESVKHAVQPLPVLLPAERVPKLQESHEFKHRIRSMAKEHPLDNHLIPNRPQGPGQRGKHCPEEASTPPGPVSLGF